MREIGIDIVFYRHGRRGPCPDYSVCFIIVDVIVRALFVVLSLLDIIIILIYVSC